MSKTPKEVVNLLHKISLLTEKVYNHAPIEELERDNETLQQEARSLFEKTPSYACTEISEALASLLQAIKVTGVLHAD
jgi:hypothetical protein